MSDYRFVHAADLHLDSPFRGLLGRAPEQAAVLRDATFAAYDRIVDLCIAERVDALLVAGDVFDSAEQSLRAQIRFRDGLERLSEAGIAAFVAHGNHDPLDGWRAGLAWPERAHRFGPEVESLPLRAGDPRSPLVHGVSYPTRDVRTNLVPRFPAADPERAAIGVLHANVGADTGHEPYAPCSVEDLARTGYAYWALGHVHTRAVLRGPEAGAPAIVYPGNPQGRHPNERGARGVYLVDLDRDGRVGGLEFRATDLVRWDERSVDIAALADEDALLEALEAAAEEALEDAAGRDVVYRLRLAGRGPLHPALGRPGALDDLRARLDERHGAGRPFAICGRIVDETRPALDRDALARGGDFVADLLRIIDEVRDDPAARDALGDEARLDELFASPRGRRYLVAERPAGEALGALIADAEALLLDWLAGDEGAGA